MTKKAVVTEMAQELWKVFTALTGAQVSISATRSQACSGGGIFPKEVEKGAQSKASKCLAVPISISTEEKELPEEDCQCSANVSLMLNTAAPHGWHSTIVGSAADPQDSLRAIRGSNTVVPQVGVCRRLANCFRAMVQLYLNVGIGLIVRRPNLLTCKRLMCISSATTIVLGAGRRRQYDLLIAEWSSEKHAHKRSCNGKLIGLIFTCPSYICRPQKL